MLAPPTRLALFLVCLMPLAGGSHRIQDGGDEAQDVLAEAEAALELAPDNPQRLTAAMEASIGAADRDRALWYAILALEHSPRDKSSKARDQELMEFLKDMGGDAGLPWDLQEDNAKALFRLAKNAESRKLYANAADLLARCNGTVFEEQARERLEKLFSKDKALDALLASGIDVKESPRKRKSPGEIARFDASHDTWDKAAEFKGKYYTVRTDMGYEMGTAFLEAMEQMNAFYRQVFKYKVRGQTMRRCTIHVYRSRAVFEEQEPQMKGRPTTRGFFVPGENRVAAYDRRTDGGSLDDLWSTLFHEASHQFTRAVWPGLIPTWLNEGTASYFEGAKLKPGGRVEKNLVPKSRLGNVVSSIRSGAVRLKDVVSYFQAGSYPGEYYPFGWSLVYFCHNYEDAQGERPWLGTYREFMESYKGAGKHDVFERFVEYFVEKPGVPGITTYGEFEELWKNWILELHGIWRGGPEQADVLLARAATQVANGKHEAAVETCRWALRKRSGDAQALTLLAQSLTELGQKDAAMFTWRQLNQVASEAASRGDDTAQDAEAWRTEAQSGMARVDSKLAEALVSADEGLVNGAQEGAQAWLDAGSPRIALHLLGSARKLLGRPSKLDQLSQDIAEEHGVSVVRWERLALNAENWRLGPGFEIQGDELVGSLGGYTACTWREPLQAPFRLEVEAQIPPGQDAALIGVVYGGNAAGAGQAFMLDARSGQVGLLDTLGGTPTVSMRHKVELQGDRVLLEVVADETGTKLFVDGEEATWSSVTGGAKPAAGYVGVSSQGQGVRFRNVRLKR